MPPPPARVLDRLRQAALLRATGTPWPAVAAALGVTPDTARAWQKKYPQPWRAASRAAAKQVLAEATAEAVLTLRKHLRSDDDKASRDAAVKLVQFAGRAAKPRAGKPKPAAGAGGGLAGYIEGMTDDQLDVVIAELLPGHDPAAGGGTRRPRRPGRPA